MADPIQLQARSRLRAQLLQQGDSLDRARGILRRLKLLDEQCGSVRSNALGSVRSNACVPPLPRTCRGASGHHGMRRRAPPVRLPPGCSSLCCMEVLAALAARQSPAPTRTWACVVSRGELPSKPWQSSRCSGSAGSAVGRCGRRRGLCALLAARRCRMSRSSSGLRFLSHAVRALPRLLPLAFACSTSSWSRFVLLCLTVEQLHGEQMRWVAYPKHWCFLRPGWSSAAEACAGAGGGA